ncbi:MAG: lysine-sensitive aspartokinase 3 [Acidobacteriia bacterium]|nr:lysine-sensitive aspartokinase 3 [Terriglobia bacterium]
MGIQRPTILKFGGTSVEDTNAFDRVASIVLAQREALPVVVVSAMGGVTDALLGSVRLAEHGSHGEAVRSLESCFERYLTVAKNLCVPETPEIGLALDDARRTISSQLQQLSQRPRARAMLEDEIVSYGERLSALVLSRVLRQRGLATALVDARRCIVTDDEHGRAVPLWPETDLRTRAEIQPLLDASTVPVLGGFIGASREGLTTTLGRGGSDYTAALVGAALSAREIQIWTDVTGVLTADPRLVKNARTITRLSYAEAAELAYFGAKVLHPKTVHPAVDRGIPLRICNSRAPQKTGTMIGHESEISPRGIKAIAHKAGITTLQISSGRMLGAYGFLRSLFEVFERHRTVVDVVTTSEVSVSLSLDNSSALPAILKDLEQLGTVEVEDHRAIICVVGEGLRSTSGIAGRVFGTLRDINISLISQGASRINLTFVIDEAFVGEAVSRLHKAFFEVDLREMGVDSEAVIHEGVVRTSS